MQTITVYRWGRLAGGFDCYNLRSPNPYALLDRIGRKPVVLLGMTGTMAATIGFGSSQSFWQMVFFRGLAGALNGNDAYVTDYSVFHIAPC